MGKPPSMSAGTAAHDHSPRSGAREQGIGRWGAAQQAAIEQAPEDVPALPAAVEPLAVLVEIGLQIGRADAVEDARGRRRSGLRQIGRGGRRGGF